MFSPGYIMSSRGISRRIYTEFGITLFLLCTLAIVSALSIWNLAYIFSEYLETARQSLSINQSTIKAM